MKEYSLRKWNDPVLREECKVFTDFENIGELLDNMHLIMNSHKGGGIAAPQVGVTSNVVLAEISGITRPFINPIIERSSGYLPFLEGCLSFPGLAIPTLRKASIDINYQDSEGNQIYEKFKGFYAILLQHEIDHLNGKLMFHYIK
jgi:peptide deformylase